MTFKTWPLTVKVYSRQRWKKTAEYMWNRLRKLDIKHLEEIGTTYVAKSIWIPEDTTHMWLLNMWFQNFLVSGFPPGLITCCRDLLPLRHKSISEVQRWRWQSGLPHSRCLSLTQRCWWGWGQSSVQTSRILPHQIGRTIYLRTWLCTQGHC